eukprot:TRINITY_DN64641_c0_g1_i1.p1 TRINITY_DN64641_c0_g1~~TRINITY_DN64641_c0_g1_i1.p1  ORF type:complete len:255 (-),score=37.77 TRINITY_DN64641_c0_g1_i1:121-885(-)
MIRRPPRSTLSSSSAASDVYKRQALVHEPTSGVVQCLLKREGGRLTLSCPSSSRLEVLGEGCLLGRAGDLVALLPVGNLAGLRAVEHSLALTATKGFSGGTSLTILYLSLSAKSLIALGTGSRATLSDEGDEVVLLAGVDVEEVLGTGLGVLGPLGSQCAIILTNLILVEWGSSSGLGALASGATVSGNGEGLDDILGSNLDILVSSLVVDALVQGTLEETKASKVTVEVLSQEVKGDGIASCLLYTSPSPRDS